nr:hypothetical protein [Clostridioides sp.]
MAKKKIVVAICLTTLVFCSACNAVKNTDDKSKSKKEEDTKIETSKSNQKEENATIRVPEIKVSNNDKSDIKDSYTQKPVDKTDSKPDKNESNKPNKKPGNNNSGKYVFENNKIINSNINKSKVNFNLPKTAYIKDNLKISDKLIKTIIIDNVKKDGKIVNADKYIISTLGKEGGNIAFKEAGSYTLKFKGVDTEGKSYSLTSTLKVYPVIETKFNIPDTSYTDKFIEVKPEFKHTSNVNWEIKKDGNVLNISKTIEGNLSDKGGKIRFKDSGKYEIRAYTKNALGRTFEYITNINIYPISNVSFNMDAISHTDKKVNVSVNIDKDMTIQWIINKDKNDKNIIGNTVNNLSNKGGSIQFTDTGDYTVKLVAKDKNGRSFTSSRNIKIYPFINVEFNLPKTAFTSNTIGIKTENTHKKSIKWDITKDNKNIKLSDAIIGNLDNNGGNIKFRNSGVYKLTAKVTDEAKREFVKTREITVYNEPTSGGGGSGSSNKAPSKPEVKVDVTNKVKDQKFLVNITADSTDPEGDEVTYEYIGKSENNYYEPGHYIIKVRSKDSKGKASAWVEFEFDVINNPPTKPVVKVDVTREYKDGKFLVNISAESTDSDINDKVTYEYLGKSQDNFYETGSYLLKVRAVDSFGDKSDWKEFTFDVINKPPTTPKLSADVTRKFKDGKFLVNITADSTDPEGDNLKFEYEGKPEDNYYSEGSHTVKVRAVDEYGSASSWSGIKFEIVNNPPTNPVVKADVTRQAKDGKFLVNLIVNSVDPDGDKITYEYVGKSEDGYYSIGKHTVRVRAVDEFGKASEWEEIKFEIVNNPPTNPVVKADVTRQAKDGKFLVNLIVNSVDPDGDKITYEYVGKSDDDYYSVGKYTVKVRAVDEFGEASEWEEIEFEIVNSPPSTPVIKRTPGGNNVLPGTPVTITADSTDPDGDDITYVWENRPSETYEYPLGRNVVRVKAVDSSGTESSSAAIVFFVMDSEGNGGMVLSGRDSVILEEGIEDATIANYTFTVPPVSGHNGNDYGRVKGYNIKTKTWEQLDYKTTSNGVTLTKELEKGVYSKLEFYYYTDHNCMYNKSNITYSVEYDFDVSVD